MCGPPGSGKTTLARLLVKQLRAVSLSPDEWMTQLGVAMDHPLRDSIGQLRWKLAQELLKNGQSVTLESRTLDMVRSLSCGQGRAFTS
jgi:predicted kinase